MENRDWEYWQKKMDEWTATGTKPTEEELAEMLQSEPPATSPEQKALIRQHGTRKQKELLAQEEYLRTQRDILKRAFLEERKKK
ncbi:MAG TPA: hypothetical protein VK859_07195 [bacterium]|jgi:hypothetical protein|nr:hypothetical protein [bacterium]